jgi:FtsP/CotA-like multicopper oxidase with cupredoxin domain
MWDVVNTRMMDHPFHLHGFFFQVLERRKEAGLAIAGGRHQRASEGDRPDRVVSRRQARHVDVPLPTSSSTMLPD